MRFLGCSPYFTGNKVLGFKKVKLLHFNLFMLATSYSCLQTWAKQNILLMTPNNLVVKVEKCDCFPSQELFRGVKLASLTNPTDLRSTHREQFAYPKTELNL